MPKLTQEDEDLAASLLTPDELAALKDDTTVDEGELNSDGAVAQIPDVDNPLIVGEMAGKLGTDTGAEEELDPAPAPAPAPAAAAPAAAAEPAPATPPAPAAPPAPEAAAPPPRRDFDKEISDVKASQQALAEKFDAGDITAVEYETQRSQLEDKLFVVRSDQRDDVKAAASAAESFFQTDVPKFLTDNPAYAAGTIRHIALNAKVTALQEAEIKRTGDINSQYDKRFLKEAFDAIEKELGPTKAPAPAGAVPAIETRQLPPSISKVPASATDDDITTSGRWAALDRLQTTDPEAYETAVAGLSEADRNAYLMA